MPFSTNEIQKLWDNIQFPFVDMVLIGIYSGFRPQELTVLKTVNIDFENMKQEDKTIFISYYYHSKSIKQIAKEINTPNDRRYFSPIHNLINGVIKHMNNTIHIPVIKEFNILIFLYI